MDLANVVTYKTEAEVHESFGVTKIKTVFKFYRSDPLAVNMVFTDPLNSQIVEWQVSRELFRDGMTEMVGEGDVSLWPHDSNMTKMAIFLSDGRKEVHMTVPLQAVKGFLRMTEYLVPYGAEAELVTADLEEWLEAYS